MELIKALYKVVRSKGVERPYFPPPFQRKQAGSMAADFYDALQQGNEWDDATVAREILQSSPSASRFKTFKHERLKELINSILFLNLSKNSEGIRAFRKCMYYLFAGKLLTYMGRMDQGIHLLRKSLVVSDKMDFTEERLNVLRMLEYYYMQEGREQKCMETFNQAFECMELLKSELYIQYQYRMLIKTLVKKAWGDESLVQASAELEKKADRYKRKYESFDLMHYWLNTKIIARELNGDYKRSLDLCYKGYEYFSHHARKTRVLPGIFLLKALNCYLHLNRYHRGVATAKIINTLLPPQSPNRLLAYQYQLLFYLHFFRPGNAFRFYQSITDTLQDFPRMSAAEREKWDLLIGYLAWMLMYECNVKDRKLTPAENTLIKPFLMYKHDQEGNLLPIHFRDKFPLLSGDKKGWNIPLRILEVLILREHSRTLETARFRLEDIGEGLEQYNAKHLEHTYYTQRSALFMTILARLCERGFTPEEKAKANPYMKNLKSIKLRHIAPSHLQEVVPAEVLWECL